MNAELIRWNKYGMELRHAENETDTWPGCDESCPLPKPGYWIGTYKHHEHVGYSYHDAIKEWEHRNQAT